MKLYWLLQCFHFNFQWLIFLLHACYFRFQVFDSVCTRAFETRPPLTNSNSKHRFHKDDFKQISNQTYCGLLFVKVIQANTKTIITISGWHDKFVNSSIRNWVVSYFKISHCHPNVFTFPALKTLWTQEIVILILCQIISHTEDHYFDHVVLTLESQNNSSRTEIYSVSYKIGYFSKTLFSNNMQFLALRNIAHSIKIL